MATINRAAIRKELEPGLNALFGLTYNDYPDEWSEVFDTESSEKAFEEEVMLSGFGLAATKAEGNAISYQDAQEVWTARYDHETVAMGFVITREAMEDNLYDNIAKRYTKAMARAMKQTKETKGAAIINRAFNTSYTGGDGKELCATDHPLLSGGTLANRPTTDADLNETSLEDAIIQISKWTDERGLKVQVKPRKVLVPTDLAFVIERLMASNLRVGTADNDTNAIRSMGAIPQGYAVNHYLADTDAWYILTDAPDGLKHFQRRGMETGMEDSFDTESMKYKASERYSFGWSDWRSIWGTSGAA